jgi:hypothetical protein
MDIFLIILKRRLLLTLTFKENTMKNIMMAVCLLAATVALSACGTAKAVEPATSAGGVMEKSVTK